MITFPKKSFSTPAVMMIIGIIVLTAGTAFSEQEDWMRFTVQGEKLVKDGRYMEALDFFKKAAAIQKKSTRVYMNIAVCSRFLYEQAENSKKKNAYYNLYVSSLEKVLSLEPAHTDARYMYDSHLGIIPRQKPFQEQEAKVYFEAAVEPVRIGALEAAQELLSKALEIEEHPAVLKQMGVVEFQKRNFRKAASYFHDSLEINRIQPSVYMMLGEIAEAKQEYSEAKHYYIMALAAYPHFFEAMQKISIVSKKMKQKASFFVLVDPVPKNSRNISPDNTEKIRDLSQEMETSFFQLQCWLVYHDHINKEKKKHDKVMPDIPFELDPDTETKAIGVMLDFYNSYRETMGGELKHFEILSDLKNKGLLKPAVFFYRWRDTFSEDFIDYRENNFKKICRMFEEHL